MVQLHTTCCAEHAVIRLWALVLIVLTPCALATACHMLLLCFPKVLSTPSLPAYISAIAVSATAALALRQSLLLIQRTRPCPLPCQCWLCLASCLSRCQLPSACQVAVMAAVIMQLASTRAPPHGRLLGCSMVGATTPYTLVPCSCLALSFLPMLLTRALKKT